MSIGLEGAYRNYLGLYSDVSASISASFHFGSIEKKAPEKREVRPTEVQPEPLEKEAEAQPEKPVEKVTEEKGEGVKITRVEFVNIFPVFFKYYDNNPIGKVTIKNAENVPVENVKVSFYEKQYMNNPKEAEIIERMEPGEEKEVELYGLFTSKILEITEGTKLSSLITIDYTKEGQLLTREFIETVRVYNRNAMTWDDDRKASAFVTAKDPNVLKFAKNVVGWIKNDMSRAVNENLQIAIALHETLDLYGISYIIDPTTPYIELSQNELAIDYLQFPKQTLEFLAGDCDDLSILYASLLEASGIETAFVTTPGHIFIAFNLGMSPDEARDRFLYPD